MRLILFAAALASAATTNVRPGHIDAELMASSTTPRPGATIVVGLRMTPQPGWHGYWSNPGESGLAPTVSWTAPLGVRFGPLLHPAPTLLRSMGLISYVHSGPYMLVSRMTLSGGIKPGTTIPVTADLNWAACSKTQCVPQHAQLSLQMVAGDGTKSTDATALRQALGALPRRASSGTFLTSDGQLFLQLPKRLHLSARSIRFFPDVNGYFAAAHAHVIGNSPPTIVAQEERSPPDQITGVVSDGSSAYRLKFHRGEIAASSLKGQRPASNPQHATTALPARPNVGRAPSAAAEQPLRGGPSWFIRSLVLLGLLGFATFMLGLARRAHGRS